MRLVTRVWLAVGIGIAGLSLAAPPVWGQACEPAELAAIGGAASSSTVDGHLAYVANSEAGLLILDVADPGAPTEIGRLNLPGRARHVALLDMPEGKLAYVACWSDIDDQGGGVYVVDAGDPTAPKLLRSIGQLPLARDLAVYHSRLAGPQLFVCEWSNGISIFDLDQDPRNPLPLSRWQGDGSAADIAFMSFDDTEVAVIAGFTAGLQFLDVTDPIEPTLLSTVSQGTSALAVEVADERVYVSVDGGQFRVWQVADPTDPTLLGVRGLARTSSSIKVDRDPSGDVVYTAEGIEGMNIYRESAPGTYDRLSTIAQDEVAWDVQFADGLGQPRAYITGPTEGLAVIDIADPTEPAMLGRFEQQSSVRHVFAHPSHPDILYVGGLGVVDVADPANPKFLGYPSEPVSAYDMAFNGNLAVTSGRRGLYTVDLSDPLAPAVLGSAPPSSGGHARGVAIDGNIAYLCGPDDDFEVLSFLRSYDITDPATPLVLDEFETVALGSDVDAADGMLYYANGNLDIFDTTSPADLTLLYDERGAFVTDTVVRDNLLYSASVVHGLRIDDVSNPANPITLATIEGFGRDAMLVLDGNRAFVADGESGVHIFDVSDPTDPQQLTTVVTPDDAIGVAVLGKQMYVAARYDGLYVYDLSACGRCRADLDGDGQLTIFDFLAFQNAFDAGDPIADFDGDGDLTIFDFLAFQNEFDAGCG